MGTNYNPKIVTDGLVLCLDTANQKSKSYNVLSNSENLSGLLSLRSGASITSNSTTAPDGTNTADLVTGTGSGFGYYFPSWPVGNATHSWFLKPNGTTTTFTFNHVGTGTGGTFNFSTKQFSSLSNYTGSYEELSNGWYLVNFHTTNESNNYYVELSFNSNDGAYIWGSQLTPFSFYKRYIPQREGFLSVTNNNLWCDLSGRGSNGTLTNGPTFSGSNGGSLVFDGVNDYVFMTGFPTSNFMTLSCWFRTSVQQSNKYLVAFGKNLTGNNGFDLTFQNTQIGSYAAVTGTGSGGNLYTVNYYDNIWHHLVSTYDGSSCKVYYDGNLVATMSGMSGNLDIEATKRLNIGSWVNNGSNANCSIAQVSIYNRALTAQEIQQNFNATRGRYGI